MADAFPRSAYEPLAGQGAAPGAAGISLFPHQLLIQDLYQINSPYRGALLYHGLGSGKSCSSIAAAETFLTAGRRIFAMVPASLETNYRTEIGRCSSIGNPQIKLWMQLKIAKTKTAKIYAELTERLAAAHGLTAKFVSTMAREHDHHIWIPAATPGIPAKFVVPGKDSVAWADLSADDQAAVRALITEMTNTKVKFVHYNGVTQKGLEALGPRPFDDAFIVIDEVHNYISRVVNGGKIARRLYRMLMDATNAKIVLLTGTPIINHPYESATLLNLIRGTMYVETYSLLKNETEIPTEAAVRAALGDAAGPYVDTIHIVTESRTIEITLVPEGFARRPNGAGGPAAVKAEPWPVAGRRAMLERVHRALSGTFKIAKRTVSREAYAFPGSRDEFGELFLDETTDPEEPRILNRDLFVRRALGCVSYLKTVNEAYLPQELPRVTVRVPMSDYQFSKYAAVRNIERKMESGKQRGPAGAGGLLAGKNTVYRAFSRMALNYVFPESIKRPFPKDIDMKVLESEISVNEDDAEIQAVATAEAPTEATVELGPEAAAKAMAERIALKKRRHEELLTAALAALRAGADEFLTPHALATYSPKFRRMLQDIQASPGSVLVYSQFRTVEGLGILSMILDAAGFVPLRVRRKTGSAAAAAGASGDWEIEDAERVLSPAYDGKRYAVFTDDREKTRLILQIFNSQWDQLPESLANSLRAATTPERSPRSPGANLYGDLCRVFLISQSATEGITTLNVRRVLITEPYWNNLRLQQVAGRAIRAYSHQALPAADRNVQVFQYETILTPKQLKESFTIQRMDKGLTSDQHIRDIAGRKDNIIRQFLDMLKAAAVDCVIRAPENRITEAGLTCYAFPSPIDAPGADEEAYVPSLAEDAATPAVRRWAPDKMEQRRSIRGRVVILPTGQKVVYVEGREGLFDYDAYRYAGVLISVAPAPVAAPR